MLENYINYLIQNQNLDGGFGYRENSNSIVETTAFAILALHSHNAKLPEIQKAIRYFNSQTAQNNPLQRVVLTSGTAQLPGLVEELTEKLAMEVLLAAPFATATGDIPAQNHQVFAVCMGLLMREGE